MNKRELELIYMDYLEEINQPPIDNKEKSEYIISKEKKEKIMDMFKNPIKIETEKQETTKIETEKQETTKIERGQVYLMFKKHIPIFYLIIDEVSNSLYKVLKLSNYYELATDTDLLTKINDEIFIIETWNFFYLKDREIKDSIFYGKIDEKDLEILTKYLNEEIEELPESKRGLKVPFNEDYIQIKFHKKESELVRDYELRIFLLMEDEEEIVLEIPPEREVEIQLPLVAGKRKTLIRTDEFLIRTDEENNILEIIFVPQLKGKKAKIKFFDEELEIESLPEKIYIEPSEDVKNIDLEKLKQKIKVQVE